MILASAAGGDPRLVATALTDAKHPAFLPDGSHLVSGAPAFSPAGGRIAVPTVRRCTTHCDATHQQCTNLIDRVEVIDLVGRRRRATIVGRNYCSADGDLGGDLIGGVAWQALPVPVP